MGRRCVPGGHRLAVAEEEEQRDQHEEEIDDRARTLWARLVACPTIWSVTQLVARSSKIRHVDRQLLERGERSQRLPRREVRTVDQADHLAVPHCFGADRTRGCLSTSRTRGRTTGQDDHRRQHEHEGGERALPPKASTSRL
jgi:hypothetical protein